MLLSTIIYILYTQRVLTNYLFLITVGTCAHALNYGGR